MEKHHLNNYWTGGNFYAYSCTVSLLVHMQYYQRSKPMTLKIVLKSKFSFWKPRYYNLLSSDDIPSGHFTWSNSIILVESLKYEREILKYFLLTTVLVIYEIISKKYCWYVLKILLSVSLTLYHAGQFTQVLSAILCLYVTCSYMNDLSACKRGHFKSYDC